MYTEQYIIIDRKFNDCDPFFEFMIENKYCRFRHTIYYEGMNHILYSLQNRTSFTDYEYNEITSEEYYAGLCIKLEWKDAGAFLTFKCVNTGNREAHKVELCTRQFL